jgi:hypothetical protein
MFANFFGMEGGLSTQFQPPNPQMQQGREGLGDCFRANRHAGFLTPRETNPSETQQIENRSRMHTSQNRMARHERIESFPDGCHRVRKQHLGK